NNRLGDKVPKTNLKTFAKTADAIFNGIQKGKILAAHDVSEGGVITSVFEMCVGGDMGAILRNPKGDGASILFNETAGTFIVEVEDEQVAKNLFKNVPF